MPQQTLDQDAVNLAKAIRQTESGNNPTAKGGSGEFGAYQWMPDTWASSSQRFLGQAVPLESSTLQQQNEVAYKQIKEWKDQGYNPGQIASMWNAGKGKPNAYIEGNKGTNTQGVEYDTQAYATKVAQAYKQIKGGVAMGVPGASAPSVQVPGLPPPPQHNAPVTEEVPPPPEEKKDGILATMVKDPFKTLLVKPGARVAELIGRTGILGENIKRGYEEMSKSGESQRLLGVDVEAQKSFGEGGAKQIVGDAAKAGSYLYTGGKLGDIVSSGVKGLVGKTALQGATTGAVSGGMYGFGEGIQKEGAGFGDVAIDTALGAGFGGVAGGVLGGVGGAIRPIINRGDFAKRLIQEDVEKLLTNGRAMQNATQLAKQKNVPIEEILSDPEVFRGLKVEGGRIAPDDAVAVLDDRIDLLMGAKSKLLPELDRVTMPVSREAVRAEAKASVVGQMAPADESALLRSIDAQVDALPENMTLSQLDKLRAQFRKSARNARGLQKSDSEYTALENATRDVLFKQTDQLPFDTNGEFPALNNEIKNLIGAREFADKTLRGRSAPETGWAKEATARIVGAVAGSPTGPFGALMGSELGRMAVNIIANKQLGSSMKMKLIKNMTDDPAILKAVEELLEKAKGHNPLDTPALPAPAIQLGPKTVDANPQLIPAPKGPPAQRPKGTPQGGQMMKTYLSTTPDTKGLLPAVGMSAGAEQDDQGNLQVDPLKAGAGMVLGGLMSRGKGVRAGALTTEWKNLLKKRNALIKMGNSENSSAVKNVDKALIAIEKETQKQTK